MDSSRITQQTSTTLPLRGELTHDAPAPRASRRASFAGPLQWALEGPGWGLVRPVGDFLLLCVAVVVALGGISATLHVSAGRAPLLALPPLASVLFYLRGVYRSRLRTLLLDGFLPVLSGVSVASMGVAALGVLCNGQVPDQTGGCARGCSRYSASASGAWSWCSSSAGRASAISSASRC